MNANFLVACALSFVLGIGIASLFSFDAKLVSASIGLSLILVLAELLRQKRLTRFQQFQKMLDAYNSRHEKDLSQSGGHLL